MSVWLIMSMVAGFIVFVLVVVVLFVVVAFVVGCLLVRGLVAHDCSPRTRKQPTTHATTSTTAIVRSPFKLLPSA